MTNETNEQIDHYAGLFEELQLRVGDKDVALALLHETAKDRRMETIRQLEASRMNGNGAPATPRQRAFLEARGISTAGLSKAAASEKIDVIKSQEAR